jgi:outer membrane protein assembly factor BamB
LEVAIKFSRHGKPASESIMSNASLQFWFAALFAALLSASTVTAGDWPQWRYDGQRSAAAPGDLPTDLSLHWVRQLPRLTPAWPDQAKMQFDVSYEPIVAGQRLFIGSSFNNSVTAYDTRTGDEIWKVFADGPVRFAPLAWQDKLYFVSDDGYLYCLHAADGSLVWRFRGGPSDRKILGNERLCSMWPARGAPVIADGKIYFAAGIWPFMGIFLHALDAETGDLVWTNDGDGSTYMKQPHNADSFAGVAPQGALVAIGDRLLVPGGRSVPACYDRATGKLLYYQLAENAKRGGGSSVAAVDQLIFNGGAAFDVQAESYLGAIGEHLAFGDGQLFDYFNREVRAQNLSTSQVKRENAIDRKGAKIIAAKWSIDQSGKCAVPALTALIKSGGRLYAGTQGKLIALALPLSDKQQGKPAWEVDIEGTPATLIAADDRLFAATLEGRLYCFGATANAPAAPAKHEQIPQPLARDETGRAKAESILHAGRVRDGYCVIWGAGAGSEGLVSELVSQTDLRIVVIEQDLQVANLLRAALTRAGVGGARVTLLVAGPTKVELPPYLASLSIIQALPTAEEAKQAFLTKVFDNLRPFGGVACLPPGNDVRQNGGQTPASTANTAASDLAGRVWKSVDSMMLLVREGPLPGSADWTHEHADASNTRVSKDTLVKAPLGLLWFGGPGNDVILPRHGHGPQPQVCQGRMFVEGMDLLRALDIYTGRLLWETSLPGVGALYNNTAHQPGANSSGTNFIATPSGVYVAIDRMCVKLDPATGQKAAEYRLPPDPGANEAARWGYLNVFENYLVGGANPLFNDGLFNSRGENDNYSSSSRLVVMDANNGQVIWTADAKSGFRHNAICIGGGRLYCIDRMSGPELSRSKRRGENPANQSRLIVFDLASGKQLWTTEQDVFGTWLSYSAEHDVLVEAGRVASDTISDEPKGMRTYRAGTGEALWENKSFSGPAMLHHNAILMAGKACDLMTGTPKMREHPLSGEPVEWTWSRNYGCNTPMASEHLITFRSGAAGYLDFCNDGGTGNFGGFRSSCSNNLIVAGGLLTAPDYTRTCVCSYQNQTSLALVPMSDVEMWTSFGSQTPNERVRNLGINFGAPGDRKDDAGTLWLEHPSIGGSSPTVAVALEPSHPEWFRRHSSQVAGPGLSWVAASGAKGLHSVRIKIANAGSTSRKYTLRLHFMEPDMASPGERRFGVRVQGNSAIEALDVVKEAGGRHRCLVKEIAGVEIADELAIDLVSDTTAKNRATLLSGIEIHAEGW